MSADHLIRGVTEDGEFRFAAAITTSLSNDAKRRHQTVSGATQVLSETMTAVALLGSLLEGDEKISLQITSDGRVKNVLADIDAKGSIRGFINSEQIYADTPDMPGGPPPLGMQGTIMVMRSTPAKLLQRGTVPLVQGDIASDVANYLTVSEQRACGMAIRSSIASDWSVADAGGILIEALPGASQEKLDGYRRVLAAPALRARVLESVRPEDMVETLMNAVEHESPYRILARSELRFQCTCSREKVADMIRGISKEELTKMRDEDGQAEVICRFCNERYVFDRAELGMMLHDFGRPS